MIVKAITLAMVFAVVPGAVSATETPVMPKVVAVAGRQPGSIVEPGSPVIVLTGEELRESGARSLSQALDLIPSVHLGQRGTPGSQADIAIAGSSFEAVAVMINGVRATDPQTGHFSLDIPLTFASVARIEVLPGGGTSLAGPGAAGGIVNIVTEPGAAGWFSEASGGSHGLAGIAVGRTFRRDGGSLSISLDSRRSDGYRPHSEFRETAVDVIGDLVRGRWEIGWHAGLQRKKFGAGDFYAPYPSEESVVTSIGGLTFGRSLGERRSFHIRFGARGHGDDFILIADNPSVYRNIHYNRSYTAEGVYSQVLGNRAMVRLGAATEIMGITSGSLGSHADRRYGLTGELSAGLGPADYSVSLRVDHDSREGMIVSPAAVISGPLARGWWWHVRVDRSYRPPTYTERFYDSPGNLGDPDLLSEKTDGGRAGLEYRSDSGLFRADIFTSRSRHVIDWIRDDVDQPWVAVNHGIIETNGLAIDGVYGILDAWRVRFGAVLLAQSVSDKGGTESKYALNPLERSVTATVSGPAPFGADVAVTVRHERQRHFESRTPVTVTVGTKVGNARVELSVRNLFNERYLEQYDLPAPGRWLAASIRLASGE